MSREVGVKITLTEIYKKLCDVEDHVIITNGKVKLNRWIAALALTLILTAMGFTNIPSLFLIGGLI